MRIARRAWAPLLAALLAACPAPSEPWPPPAGDSGAGGSPAASDAAPTGPAPERQGAGTAPRSPAASGPEHWRAQGREAIARARSLGPLPPPARNLILFVGDGLSLETVLAARILQGQRRGEPGEENWLAFERFPHVALVKTYNTDQQIPDSAGTMSAIMTGVKTRAGVISMDERVTSGVFEPGFERYVVPTLLEQAEQRGLATGIVTTTSITHATPAACYAHAFQRGWQSDAQLPAAALRAGFPDIARQLVELPHGDGIEVALGGGRRFFLPEERSDPVSGERGDREDERDLTEAWQQRRPRSAYVWSAEQLAAVDPAQTDHLLGLFAFGDMSFEIDREKEGAGEPSLATMTAKAIELLARAPKGFFLMVEGGRIDHAHHDGSAYRALTETLELDAAVRAALARVSLGETLVVATADHGHTLTIGGHATRGNPILGKVVENDDRGVPEDGFARDATGSAYTTLGYANGPGYTGAHATQPEGPKRWTEKNPVWQRGIRHGTPDLSRVDTEHPDYLQTAAVPLPSESHSGTDVPAYATGPRAQLFHGVQEQSYLYYAMAEALGWLEPAPAAREDR